MDIKNTEVEEVIKDQAPEVDGDTGEKKPEKTFTQAEYDEGVKKRIARVKAELPEDYEDLRTIASDLEEYGFVGTVAEKKKALKAARVQNKADRELQDIEDEAATTGHSPEIIKKLKDAQKKLKDAESKLSVINDVEAKKHKEIEDKQKADDEWQVQVDEFEKDYPDIDVKQLEKDEDFIKYANKHNGGLKGIYEDYNELMDAKSQSIAEKFKRSESRSTGGGKNAPASGGSKLSTSQQKTMEDWNKRFPKMKLTPKDF